MSSTRSAARSPPSRTSGSPTASGVIGCAVIAAYFWWLGVMLLVMWLIVRRVMLRAVLRQAIDVRGQTTEMRRAWYIIGVGSKARDAKEVRVFGLAKFLADRYTRQYTEAIGVGLVGLRALHRRAATCFACVLAGYALAIYVIADAARTHQIGLGALAILLPMLAITAAVGSVSYDDITLAQSMFGLPDADRLERDLLPPSELGTAPEGRAPEGRAPEGRAPESTAPESTARQDRGSLSTSGCTQRSTIMGSPADLAVLPRRAVRFGGVRFGYAGAAAGAGDGLPPDVLAGVDLEPTAGASTALVGVNGAGKSTLVSLLARLRDPTGGRITVDGSDVRGLDPARWQRMIALMPQDPVRYPLSAYDNVAFGALEHADDRDGVQRAARLSGFASVVEELRHGWDTVLARELPDTGGHNLSGGQWQKLALGRAMRTVSPLLVVLDEPTASLDAHAEHALFERYAAASSAYASLPAPPDTPTPFATSTTPATASTFSTPTRTTPAADAGDAADRIGVTAPDGAATGMITLLVSHRFATVRMADLIVYLEAGQAVETGTRDELMSANGRYAELFTLQAAGYS
ncbi:MAG: ATP-binding cassette domain-containing protein [Trebonia sp.]